MCECNTLLNGSKVCVRLCSTPGCTCSCLPNVCPWLVFGQAPWGVLGSGPGGAESEEMTMENREVEGLGGCGKVKGESELCRYLPFLSLSFRAQSHQQPQHLCCFFLICYHFNTFVRGGMNVSGLRCSFLGSSCCC